MGPSPDSGRARMGDVEQCQKERRFGGRADAQRLQRAQDARGEIIAVMHDQRMTADVLHGSDGSFAEVEPLPAGL